MTIFEWKVSILGVSVHGWTVLTLIALGILVTVRKRALKEWAPVCGMTAVTMAIHLYEAVHGLCQLIVQGDVGPVEINILCFIGGVIFLKILNRNIQILSSTKAIVIPVSLFLSSMGLLVWTGYFIDYPYNIIFGVPWAVSKIMVSLAVLSVFSYP